MIQKNRQIEKICSTPIDLLVAEAKVLLPRVIPVLRAANILDLAGITASLEKLGNSYEPPSKEDESDHYQAYAEKLDAMTLNKLLKLRDMIIMQVDYVPELRGYLSEVDKAVERRKLSPVEEK